MDYGRPIGFGFFPEPAADDPAGVLDQVLAAERAGLELVGIQDHPYQRTHLDAWSLLAWLGARTSTVTLFPDVANLPLRTPAVLAKAAASLDVLTGGRVELGIGAGGFWDAIAAMGGPRRTPGQAVDAVEEAVAVIRLMWSGERAARFRGQHYQLAGVHPGPRPAHDMGIWIGALGPRMLDLVGRVADGWLPSSPYAPPEQLPGLQARIDDGAAAAGRDPRDIRRIYNVSGHITQGATDGFLNGPVEQWVDELTGLVLDQGMDSFVLWAGEPRQQQVAVFAHEVAPAVRDRVAQNRGAS